jgi:hypothetical protein
MIVQSARQFEHAPWDRLRITLKSAVFLPINRKDTHLFPALRSYQKIQSSLENNSCDTNAGSV